jgi:putative inorganic carbon (hco3(-)) transporter
LNRTLNNRTIPSLPDLLTNPTYRSSLVWAGIAVAVGVIFAVLPLQVAVLVLIVTVLIVSSLIDTQVAVVMALVLGPLKILTETEILFFRELPIDIGQITFLWLVAVWLMKSIAARRRLFVFAPTLIPVLMIVFVAFLSAWNSVALWSTMKEVVQWAEVAVILVICVSLMRSENSGQGNPSWLVNGILAAAAAQAVIGIYEFRGGSGAAHLWILDFRYFRAFGSFGQPNPFGAFMGVALCLALGVTYGCVTEVVAMLQRRGSGLDKSGPYNKTTLTAPLLRLAFYGGLSTLLAGGLLVSWSRGAWMGFGAALVVMVFFAPKRRIIGAALVTLAVGSFALSVITGLAPQSLINRLSDFTQDLTGTDDVRGAQINDDNYAVIERLAHWQAAVGMATDNPLIGVGFGAYEIAYPRYALMNWPMALGHAHNYYLNLLAETGVIGLGTYLIAWVMIFALTLKALRQESGFRRGILLGLLGIWTHIAVHSFFDKLFVNNLLLHLGAMLGLIGFFVTNTTISRHRANIDIFTKSA